MARVSVLIPARNERFLSATVQDVLSKATGDIEVVAILDGYWPDPPLPADKRLRILHRGQAQGMRPGLNAAAAIVTGDYLLKCDAHVMWQLGFDEVLVSDYHDDDWVLVPRRDRLDAEHWCKQETGKPPIDAHYLSYPFERPGDPSCGLHGTVWTERAKARRDILLDEEMSSQGSAWFMSRRQWDRVGPLDVAAYGSFVQEFQEIGLKTWLGGGQVMVTKRTTYYHLHKGKTYGRGYFISSQEMAAGIDFATRYWMRDQWPARVHDLRWLIERFAPVPGWPTDLDAAFAHARQVLA